MQITTLKSDCDGQLELQKKKEVERGKESKYIAWHHHQYGLHKVFILITFTFEKSHF